MLVTFADEWFTYFPAGLSVSIADSLGLTYAQLGTVMASLFAGGIVGLFFTVAADYVDRRWLSSAGALAYGLAMIVFGLADSFALMIAAGFVWGAASDAFISGTDVTLIELARDDLQRTLSKQNAWSSVGDVLGPVTISAAVWAGIDWRMIFVGGGVLMIGYAAWLVSLPFPKTETSDDEESTPIRTVLALFRDPLIMRLSLMLLLFGLLDEPFLGFLLVRWVRELGFAEELASLCAGAIVAGGIAGHLAVPYVVERFSLRKGIVVAALICAVAVAVLCVAGSFPLLFIAGAAMGMFGAMFYSLLESALFELRPGQAGATSAVTSVIGMLGMFFPSFVGALAESFGLMTGISSYAVAALVMLVLTAWAYPSASKKPEP